MSRSPMESAARIGPGLFLPLPWLALRLVGAGIRRGSRSVQPSGAALSIPQRIVAADRRKPAGLGLRVQLHRSAVAYPLMRGPGSMRNQTQEPPLPAERIYAVLAVLAAPCSGPRSRS